MRVSNRFATDLQSLGAASNTLLQDNEGATNNHASSHGGGKAGALPQVKPSLAKPSIVMLCYVFQVVYV